MTTYAYTIPTAPSLKVSVTQDLIAQAIPADSSHCMIAEAVKEAFPQAHAVSVDLQTVRFSDKARRLRYVYLTPRSAQLRLIEFDQGTPVEAFKFSLRGGHVINMHSKLPVIMEGIETTADGPRKKTVTVKPHKRDMTKLNLAKQGLGQIATNGSVPVRVGGRAPPTTHLARRRAFGLRALSR